MIIALAFRVSRLLPAAFDFINFVQRISFPGEGIISRFASGENFELCVMLQEAIIGENFEVIDTVKLPLRMRFDLISAKKHSTIFKTIRWSA